MSVLIKGIEMPKGSHEIIVRIQSDGRVLDQWGHRFNQKFIAVPVPPHGDLIDRGALKDVQQADADFFKGSSDYGEKCRRDEALNAVANIVNAPTIIEAEECEACSCGGDESKCDFYEDKRKKAVPKITNADRLRALSDEELAKMISGFESFALACGGAWPPESWLKWLKREANT